MQQQALQAALQQQAMQAAYQQNLLQTVLQQNAMLVAMRQQQAAQVPSPAAQLRVVPAATAGDSLPKLQNPEDLAARQLQIARDLLADADTAQQQGEADRATRMRERAGERLQTLVENYAGTLAAAEARGLLQAALRPAKS
jgi:hypothetical protein